MTARGPQKEAGHRNPTARSHCRKAERATRLFQQEEQFFFIKPNESAQITEPKPVKNDQP
jgi:hypothetical protein